ncbi:MAG TPA: carbon starvation CstA 5TM domain-containing protein, partial [Sedimentisphaerales bacterium]|nr:carbon starvation CstA 5TM domain-containing protein [Sedimentisphaerales bacterium]
AFSTFVYDTLDVSTRLARYIFQELMGWKSFTGGCAATLICLSMPLAFILLAEEKAYLLAWPIFGTSNQMLASLTLLVLSAWLAKSGKRIFYVVIPMIFMMTMTIVALVLQIKPFITSLPAYINGGEIKPDVLISGICGAVLLGLCILVIFTYVLSLVRQKKANLQTK